MDLFRKNIFGFYSNRFFGGNTTDLYITSYFFEHINLTFKMVQSLLKQYIKETNNRVIYVSNESDARNNRLTNGKEYIIESHLWSDGNYFKIENDSGIIETYSVDYFQVKVIKKDWESTTDILISNNIAISEKGKLLTNGR